MRITVFALDDAVIVPAGAIFRIGGGWNAYVVRDGRAELRPVEVFRQAGGFAALQSGLSPGEAVILYPSDRIAAGVRVARQ